MSEPTKLERAHAIIEKARTLVPPDSPVASRLEEMRVVDGYAEPGYGKGDNVIVLGNWWEIENVEYGYLPAKVGDKFEEIGIDTEWGDEWGECSDCRRTFRTSPGSYGWTPSFVYLEDEGNICLDCLANNSRTPEYLATMEGEPGKALTPALGIDPVDYGYTLVADDFERGLHHGQAADPRAIAKLLREASCTRFIFRIDDVGQFDTQFSVHVHEDALDKGVLARLRKLLKEGETNSETSPAQHAERALREAPLPEPGQGILRTTINVDTGESVSRYVSPEDFIAGKG